MERVDLIRSLVAPAFKKGLEISPSHSPVFPKREGFKVETLDYADDKALRAHFSKHPVDIDAIEPVDHVSDGAPIHEVVGKPGCYDYVYSGHAIEHVTDFVGYFESCEKLLKPGGCAVLSIPDKRYVFNALRFPSTTGEVLEAWKRGHRRHSPARAFDFHASYSKLDGQPIWEKGSRGYIALANGLVEAWRVFQAACKDDEYIDLDAWTLTPASFELIIRDLNELGLLNLRIDKILHDGTSEFHVRMTRDAKLNTRSRCEIILDVHREQMESSLQLLGRTF